MLTQTGLNRTRKYVLPRGMARGAVLAVHLAGSLFAQKILTWEQAKQEFQASNPTLRASRIGVEQARADEITAFLRPNPELAFSVDQLTPGARDPSRPFANALPLVSAAYLVERRHKRSLRRESAQQETRITVSELADQERLLIFDLRNAFIQVLQQRAVVAVARASLEYYDRILAVSQDRFKAGDIAQVDLDRLELQRVQFATDVQIGLLSLRTAKIQLLALLYDRTPVEQFDVTGKFDFTELTVPIEELRQIALDNRPDLRAALETVEKARIDHRLAIANGSTDPVFAIDVGHDPDFHTYVGATVAVPLRIFDRNQGEKARTELGIGRNQRLADAVRTQVFSDVDSAYAAIETELTLLHPYRTRYLAQAVRVRDTISYSYQRGGSSLLDLLQAQQDYRNIQLSYINLVGSYLGAANQLNLAVGREVIQ